MAYLYKQVTCPRWKRDRCHLLEAHCVFAHQSTDRNAPYGSELTKDFTCYRWRDGTCTNDARDCPFAHNDTGLYVGRDNNASLKHITCYHWKILDDCNEEDQCLYAHEDTGILAWQPQEEAQFCPGKNSLKDYICPRWEENSQCKWIRLGCPYTHSLTGISCLDPDRMSDVQTTALEDSVNPIEHSESIPEHSSIPIWTRSVRGTLLTIVDAPTVPVIDRPAGAPPPPSGDSASMILLPISSATCTETSQTGQSSAPVSWISAEQIAREREIDDPLNLSMVVSQANHSNAEYGESSSRPPSSTGIRTRCASEPDFPNSARASRLKECAICGKALFSRTSLCHQCSLSSSNPAMRRLPVSIASTVAVIDSTTEQNLLETQDKLFESIEPETRSTASRPQPQNLPSALRPGPINPLKRTAAPGTFPRKRLKRSLEDVAREDSACTSRFDPRTAHVEPDSRSLRLSRKSQLEEPIKSAMVQKDLFNQKNSIATASTLLSALGDDNADLPQTLPRVNQSRSRSRTNPNPSSRISNVQYFRPQNSAFVAGSGVLDEETSLVTEPAGEASTEVPTIRDCGISSTEAVATIAELRVPGAMLQAGRIDQQAVASEVPTGLKADAQRSFSSSSLLQPDRLTNSDNAKVQPLDRRGPTFSLPRCQNDRRTRYVEQWTAGLVQQNEDRNLNRASPGQWIEVAAAPRDSSSGCLATDSHQIASRASIDEAMIEDSVGDDAVDSTRNADISHQGADDENEERPLTQSRTDSRLDSRSFTPGLTAVDHSSLLVAAEAEAGQATSLTRGILGRKRTRRSFESFISQSPSGRVTDVVSSGDHMHRDGLSTLNGVQGINSSSTTLVDQAVWTKADGTRAKATLMARGVQFEPDSDSEKEQSSDDLPCQRSSRQTDPLRRRQRSSNLFDIAPHLDTTRDQHRRGSGEPLEHPKHTSRPRKQMFGSLLRRQCHERRHSTGDPHQEVYRTLEAVVVTAVVQEVVPPEIPDPWALPRTETKKATISFRKFAGLPEQAVIEAGSREAELVFREVKETRGADEAGTQTRRRRVPEDGKFPFVYTR